MKTLKLLVSLLLLSQLFYFNGCRESEEESTGSQPEKQDTLVIKMIPKGSGNPVFLSAKKGAEQAAINLSEKYSELEVVVSWEAPESEEPSEQAALIRSAIDDSVDAIIVSCADRDSLTRAIDQAVEAGIQVMTFDSDCPNSKRFAFYGPDDFKMGEDIMNTLAERIGKKGKVAILGGNRAAPNLRRRVEGIKKAAEDFPDIQIIGEFYHAETEEAAIQMMDSVRQQNPGLTGWAMVGSWAFFGDKLLDKLEPGQIKIVAVDALPVELKYVEKNYAQVLLGQPTFRWGKISVETVVDKVYFKKDVDEKILLKTIPVTIENLGGWSRQLRAWGYENIPEKYLPM